MTKRFWGTAFGVFLCVMAQSARAQSSGSGEKPMHWSGDRTVWDRKLDKVELYGHARVQQPGETISADFILLDMKKRTLDAKGNCVYTAPESIIFSDEMHFNLDTRVGTIVQGRVSNGKFLLVGKRINKLGPARFQTHEAEYTTCLDCPASWSLFGQDVDLEVEGYAYMNNVHSKIKDSPVFWLPYLVIPVKSKRQTGFLFPKTGLSGADGFKFVEPFFWAINRSMDMTFGAGKYFSRGVRLEWEGRYRFADHSSGISNFNYMKDKTFDPKHDRWGLSINQEQILPFGIQEKLRWFDVTDNSYPIHFAGDIQGRSEPVLASDVILSKSAPSLSGFVSARRYRNLIDEPAGLDFDPDTVQVLPKAVITTNDKVIFNSTPVAAGLELGVTNFSRSSGPFDYDPGSKVGSPFQPGIDPIREATRASLTPLLYTTVRPWDLFSITPSVRYKNYFYSFHNSLPSLSRGFVLFQADFSFQLEKIYETYDPIYPRIKHLVRPNVTYSRIPYINQPKHPFLQQIDYRNGYNFDNNDIVPFSTTPSLVNYFAPQGHSISYGATTQLIRRQNDGGGNQYRRIVELSGGQTLNILEYRKRLEEQIPLSRFYSTLTFDFQKLGSRTQYYFYPYLSRLLKNNTLSSPRVSPHEVSTSLTYTLDKATHQQVLDFERSFSLSYTFRRLTSEVSSIGLGTTYSINDYILPSASAQFDFIAHRITDSAVSVIFQSPSRCWRFSVRGSYAIDKKFTPEIDLSLNLTGEGFGGFSGAGEKMGGG